MTDYELWPGGPVLRSNDALPYTDALLAADFALRLRFERALDLGCGIGVIMLILAGQRDGAVLRGIEIDPELAACCDENLKLNGLTDRAAVIEGDLRRFREVHRATGEYDLVISNPPYFPLGSGAVSPNPDRARARDEMTCNLADLCAAAAYYCRSGGSFCLVYRPERLSELFAALTAAGFEVKRLRMVHHRLTSPPSLILVEARWQGRPGIKVEPPLILTNADGSASEEMLKISKME